MRYRDEFENNEAPARAVAFDERSLLVRMIEDRPADLAALAAAALIALGIVANALIGQNGPHPAPLFAAAKAQPKPAATVAVPAPQARPAEVQPVALAAKPAETGPARPRPEILLDMQKELKRLGLYDGTLDGKRGPKTDSAIRDFATNIGLRHNGEPTEDLLARMKRTGQNRASSVEPKPQTQSEARSIAALITATATPQAKAAERPPEPKSIASLLAATSDQTPPRPPESFTQRQTLAIEQALAKAGFMPGRVDGIYDRETRTAIERFERERKLKVTGGLSSALVKELAAVTGTAVE